MLDCYTVLEQRLKNLGAKDSKMLVRDSRSPSPRPGLFGSGIGRLFVFRTVGHYLGVLY